MTDKHTQRMELYKQGLTDKEIAEAEGVTESTIASWRCRHKLPRIQDPDIYIYNCPMEHALNPDQCAVMRQFFTDLLDAADRCRGKKDVGNYMHTWHKLAKEGKVGA